MKYSVIIPVYNVEQYLQRCVESVLQQKTENPFEIILVDDGSTDCSGTLCDTLAGGDRRIRAIHQENKWLSAARNTGLKAACGEYVLFLDSDDYWEPELLATVDALLSETSDMAMFWYRLVYEDGRTECPTWGVFPQGESGEAYLNRLFALGMTPIPYACIWAYRRQFLVDNALAFKETLRYNEDLEFNMRALPLAKRLVGMDSALYDYFQRGNSITACLTERKVLDSLRVKAEAFHRIGAAPLADNYAWVVMTLKDHYNGDMTQIDKFVRDNWDVMEHTASPAIRLGCRFIRLFGCLRGAKCFWFMANAKRRLTQLLHKK